MWWIVVIVVAVVVVAAVLVSLPMRASTRRGREEGRGRPARRSHGTAP